MLGSWAPLVAAEYRVLVAGFRIKGHSCIIQESNQR